MSRIFALSISYFLSMWIFSSGAQATIATYYFSGTVTDANGIFAGQGSSVTGSFSFDYGAQDSDPSTEYDFFTSDTSSNQPLIANFSASLTLGSVLLNLAPIDVAGSYFAISATDTPDRLSYYLKVFSDGWLDFSIMDNPYVDAGDPVSALDGTISRLVGILDNLVTSTFSGEFSPGMGEGYWVAMDQDAEIGNVAFQWNELWRGGATRVSEPGSVGLFASGLIIAALTRRRVSQRRSRPHRGAASA